MTRILMRSKTFLTATALCAGLATIVNCSNDTHTSADSGNMSLALTLPGGLTVSSVGYTVTSGATPPATLASGTIDVTDPNATVSLDLVLAPSTGDVVSLTATAQPGNIACTGTSAPFNIVAGQNTPVTMVLQCGQQGTTAGQTGNATVTATVTVVNGDNCPSVLSTSASPGQTSVGAKVSLNALAGDNDATDALTYTWSTPAGTFATGASATFTCSPAGTQTITLTVDDHHSPSNCTTTAVVAVNCIAGGTGGTGGTVATGGTGGTVATGGTGGTVVIDPWLACQTCEIAASASQGNCDPAFLGNVDASDNLLPGPGNFGCDALPTAARVAACKALVTCINTNNCAAGDNTVQGCWCGTATLGNCLQGIGNNGACMAQYEASVVADGGEPAGSSLATFSGFIGGSFGDPTLGIGLADNVVTCSIDASCKSVCGSL